MRLFNPRLLLPVGVAVLANVLSSPLLAQEAPEITYQEQNIDAYAELLGDDMRTQGRSSVDPEIRNPERTLNVQTKNP